MRLKEIKPGMVIHCKSEKEMKALLEKAERLGYVWKESKDKPTEIRMNGIGNTIYFYDKSLDRDYKHIAWSYKKEGVTEFSDLILPELTAEEVLQAMGEICESHQVCNDCPISKATKENIRVPSYCFKSLHTHTDKVINVCAKWKSDHEKKEPEIETVDICRIIEVMPDGRKRCVNEEDIKKPITLEVEETLKRYCMEHEGEFIAVHEVVSRVKK